MHPELATQYRSRRVLVLGATGFIGRAVVRALDAVSADVTCVMRQGAARARDLEVDLLEPGSIERVVSDARPDVVFNLAGYGVDPAERDPQLAEAVNTTLVEGLADALAASEANDWIGQRCVHVGSALEYGEADGDLNEDTTPHPTTLYGRTKLGGTQRLAERCRHSGLRGVTARLFMVYGPGEHAGRLLPALVRASHTGEPLDLSEGLQQRDFTYVGDVAEGLLRLGVAACPAGDVVNLATGRLTAVRDFALAAAAALDLPVASLRFGAIPTRGHEMSHAPVSIDRLRQRTGWAPATTVEAGLRETLRRLEEEPRDAHET